MATAENVLGDEQAVGQVGHEDEMQRGEEAGVLLRPSVLLSLALPGSKKFCEKMKRWVFLSSNI